AGKSEDLDVALDDGRLLSTGESQMRDREAARPRDNKGCIAALPLEFALECRAQVLPGRDAQRQWSHDAILSATCSLHRIFQHADPFDLDAHSIAVFEPARRIETHADTGGVSGYGLDRPYSSARHGS